MADEGVPPEVASNEYADPVAASEQDGDGAVVTVSEAPPVVLAAQPYVSRRDGDWDCPKCTNLNFAFRTHCHKCREPRPGYEGQEEADTRPKRPGDWDCACGANNFAFRTSCMRCQALPGQGVARGAGGRARSRSRERGGGPGGGRPGDWTCHCGMLNFAFRTECHKCKQPKPDPSAYGYAGGAGYYGYAPGAGYGAPPPGYPGGGGGRGGAPPPGFPGAPYGGGGGGGYYGYPPPGYYGYPPQGAGGYGMPPQGPPQQGGGQQPGQGGYYGGGGGYPASQQGYYGGSYAGPRA